MRARILDGATGTELERRGVACELPLWSARALLGAPEVLRAVHRDYAAAGAQALTANTFRTQRRTLARAGLGERAAELTARAVQLAREGAREAGAPNVFVLGSAAPLEDCYSPTLVPDDATLAREHAEHARNLVAAGIDAILVETMNTAREAEAALRAAHDAGARALVSFTCAPGARLLSGEPLTAAIARVLPLSPLAIGVNCAPWQTLAPCLDVLQESRMPFFAYANLGAPRADGARTNAQTPREFAAAARRWLDAGATALGGCCGTRPEHVAALAALLP
ncbi:MAG: homocysteine S-methyltransferase family protein [Deltaproteobacteria bacterium]|nr:homocysteine S-methyltransferase family protein [Deltaproteobacteria bacterium]